MTDEQVAETIRVREYLVAIISFKVSLGDEGSERKRIAKIFLMEAMQKAGLFLPGPLPNLS